MLVEDDAPTRSALERIYTRRGWVVDVAGTVAEARAMLARRPDCLVLDLMLPDGDGVEVLRAIRRAGLPIRVAVTTGTDDRERLRAVRALRPDTLLFKPIDIADLDAALSDGAGSPA